MSVRTFNQAALRKRYPQTSESQIKEAASEMFIYAGTGQADNEPAQVAVRFFEH